MNLGNVLIFGDSYSTFSGYIPKGYITYYSENFREETDVRNVAETWWHSLLKETGSNLVLNNSWSGSTICCTGYNNTDCSETSSFIRRLNELIEIGFFTENEINTVFVFGGTNDSWAEAPIGDLKYTDWEKEELFAVLPAACYFLHTLKEQLPHAKIICLINTDIKSEIINGLKDACKHYGIQPIKFDRIDKRSGHPTVKGMQDIKNQILENMK